MIVRATSVKRLLQILEGNDFKLIIGTDLARPLYVAALTVTRHAIAQLKALIGLNIDSIERYPATL